MNKIHRIVWNHAAGQWMVASELSRSARRKSTARLSALAVALVLPVGGVMASDACVLPGGEAGTLDARGTCVVDVAANGFGIGLMGGTDGGIATGTDAVAVGPGSNAIGARSIAVGSAAIANNVANIAIGDRANTTGSNAISVGYNATAEGNYSMSLGGGSSAVGARTTALGTDAAATAGNASALGNQAKASGNFATAVGNDAQASGMGAAAFGASSKAAGTYALGIGPGAEANTAGSIAVGNLSIVDANGGVAIGLRSGVAAGATSSIAIGNGASVATGITTAVAIGSGSVATEVNTVSIGAAGAARRLVNLADGRVADGSTDAINGSQLNAAKVQLGAQASTEINDATRYFKAAGSNDGRDDAKSSGVRSVAMGANASAASEHGIALGWGATASTNTGAMAIGANARASGENSIALGNEAVADRDNVVSVGWGPGGGTGMRQIVNVANGTEGYDVVNVNQLRPAVDALGGGARIDRNGVVSGPAYTLQGTTYTNVGAALGGVDTSLNAIDARVTTIEAGFNDGSIGLVRQDATSGDITVGAQTGGGRVSVAGRLGDRLVSGVAAGVADNDAVNMAQLKAAGLVDDQGNALNAVTYDNEARDSISLGGAGATKPVKIRNVADATEDDEAINLGQLKQAGLVDAGGQTLDAVVYDAGSNRGQVTFGGANGTVLANVADGRIQSGSRDAVNGSQIAALRDQLNGRIGDIDNRVGQIEQNGGGQGGSDNPYFDANGNPVTDAGADSSVTLPGAGARAEGAAALAAGSDAQAAGSRSVAVGSDAHANADDSVALGAGSIADREGTVSVGREGQERQIANVRAGVRDTDAVNVSQLNQRMAEANNYTDQRIDDMWHGVNDRIDQASRQANRGIAAASALISVTPYLPGKTVLNAGMATYRGEGALGVGISRWNDSGRVNFNAGVSAARGDSPIFRVGVGMVLGD